MMSCECPDVSVDLIRRVLKTSKAPPMNGSRRWMGMVASDDLAERTLLR